MEIRTFVLGPFEVSAYVVVADGEAIVVDAPAGAERIVDFLRGRDLTPRTLVITHGHADHIQAGALLKETWPAMELAVGAGDEGLLTSPVRNLSMLLGMMVKSPPADRILADGDHVTVGGASFSVLATPGHSPGGISLYAADGPDGRPVVFTGDALFAGGIGRTDFPGQDHETLVRSIRERLLTLPPETIVYPGHGPESTIGDETRDNPWL